MDSETGEDVYAERQPEGPDWPGVGTDGGAKYEEEYVGKTYELKVTSDVAGGDETAQTSEGDVGFVLGLNTTGSREGEARSEGIVHP